MGLAELAARPFYTGYRSSFAFRLADREEPGAVIEPYVRQWIARLAPGAGSLSAWDGYAELDLPGGVFAQEAHSPSGDSGHRGRAFRVYLPENIAMADAQEQADVGVPGPTRRRDVGIGQRYHRTTIYVLPSELHGRPAASVLVQGATDDDSILEAMDEYEVPSIVPIILGERTCFEGETRLTAAPQSLQRKTVKQAVDAIFDPERSISVIVGSSPSPEGDSAFAGVIQSLTRRSIGTASVFVVSSAAVDVLNSRLPAPLQIPPGDVRTFLPHVEANGPIPGARHRYVGPDTLARALDGDLRVTGILPTLHSRVPRRQMLTQPLDPDLLELRAQVDRQARRGRISALVRGRLSQRQRESAERGLGPEGSASFDAQLLSGDGQRGATTLSAESTTALERQLRVTPSEDTEPAAPLSGKPDEAAESGPVATLDKPAEEEASREQPEVAQTASAPEITVQAPGLPHHLSSLDRPPLDHNAKGVKRVVSFLKRWLYPHGHEDVCEETVDAKIIEVDEVLVSGEDERDAALELIEEAQEELDHLNGQLSDAARELADARADAALAQEEANEHSSKLAFYRKQLIAARQFEALDGDLAQDHEWDTPGDLHEIAAILHDDPRGARIRDYVVFTGDLAALDAVAQRDTHGQYAAATWSFVHALHDFAQLRSTGASINVDMYLRNDELNGHKVSAHRHALHESDTVHNREDLRRLREFPVPTTVDPGGKAFMESHFRVGSGDGFSPRMYYLDNTGDDGRVYVGYIGKHPKNSMTN